MSASPATTLPVRPSLCRWLELPATPRPPSGRQPRPAPEPEPEPEPPPFERVVSRRRLLPFDLYLALGHGSVRMFGAGPFDELRFFQRCVLTRRHDVEYVTLLDARRTGSEAYQPFGRFKIAPEERVELPDIRRKTSLWRALARTCGVQKIPAAAALLGRQSLTAYDPCHETPDAGWNRVRAPDRPFARTGERQVTYAQVLEVLRNELDGPELIAWLEDAFPDRPPEGRIVHRYYLDAGLRAYLVRDHWEEGRHLFRAQTSGGDGARGLLIYGRPASESGRVSDTGRASDTGRVSRP